MKKVNKKVILLSGFLDNYLFNNKPDLFHNNCETFSIPTVNIVENLPNFVVKLVALGLKKENFSIEVEEDTLKMASNKAEEKERRKLRFPLYKKRVLLQNF